MYSLDSPIRAAALVAGLASTCLLAVCGVTAQAGESVVSTTVAETVGATILPDGSVHTSGTVKYSVTRQRVGSRVLVTVTPR